jgi:flavin reductase (DIM6/NTAB) family NADH-FMN oxidoreductase RutF
MTAALEAFHRLVAGLDYPMYIVTTTSGGEPAGCLAGFATQCSIDPARMLVCLSVRNRTFRVAQHAGVLVVHFLSGRNFELAKLFGEETGDEVDKFSRCRWVPGPGDVPVVEGVQGWVAARVLATMDAGDHTAFLVEPFAGEAAEDPEPQLSFQQVREFHSGHEP